MNKIVFSSMCNRCLKVQLQHLPEYFNSQGELLYVGRNCLKLFEIDSHKLVVKKYRKTFLTQYLSWFRNSKANKAFNNGIQLYQIGINTPNPIAYIEIKSLLGFVKESYYICNYIPHQPIANFYNNETEFEQNVIIGFAKFTAMLHERGVIHNDLNSTNVRCERTSNGDAKFWLIDINRMKFTTNKKSLCIKACFKNLTRFSSNSPMFVFFIRHYLEVRQFDKNLIKDALKIKKQHDKKVDYKKIIKQFI